MVALREDPAVTEVRVLSPLTDESEFGISAACYGTSLATGKVIEPFVIGELFGQLERGLVGQVMERGTDLATLRAEVAVLEEELAAWRDDIGILQLGRDIYLGGLRARSERRDDAHQRLSTVLAQLGVPDMPDLVELTAVWPSLTVAEQRLFVAGAIDCVMLGRGRTGVSERAVVLWRGQAPADLPGRGKVTELRSFVREADVDVVAGVAGGED
jgi:hypothetical protein